ncbi:MAG: SusC/RagA family TonB-linked outer membrane protein, partial [Flavobacteriales bacterium]
GKSTTTNAKGEFNLTAVDEDALLVISFIGHTTKEVKAKAKLGSIQLNLSTSKLDEIQIIAYGQTSKRFNTSNAESISGDVVSSQAVSNPLIALKGRVSGMFIKQTNGLNTGTLNVTVQGRNSLNNGNQPFYVIDGVPFTSNSLVEGETTFGTISTGAGMNNLNFLNSNEIESITVLKDADATAIYGSRAANGAILITTKKGKVGQTKIDLNMQTGWGEVAEKFKLLNAEQYISLRKEAYSNNNNQAIPATAVDINGNWDPTRNVDWQEKLLGKTATYNNIQTSISGGNKSTQFLAGAGYIRETPVFAGNFSNVRASVNFNINHTSNNEKFKFFLSGSYLEGNNKLPVDDITSRATNLAPNY